MIDTMTAEVVKPSDSVHSHADGKCGAKLRQSEGTCKHEAGWGTDHVGIGACKLHGGSMVNHRRKAKRVMAQLEAQALLDAEAAARGLGFSLPVEPAEAMLAMVCEAAGNVAVLRSLVATLERESVSVGQNALAVNLGSEKEPNKAVPHVWVSMYDAERERLVRWAKLCRDAGVEERLVVIAEQQGEWLVKLVEAVLADSELGLNDGQLERVPAAIGRAIGELTAGAA